MIEADCFTCRSGGKVLEQQFNGYAGSEEISNTQIFMVMDAAKQHETKKGMDHNIVIYHWKNDPEEKSDLMIDLGGI